MKKEIAEQWVTALRSSKYKQGRLRLRTANDRYCCLGVLCDISNLGEWDRDSCYLKRTTLLPKEVMDWANIKDCGGIFYIPTDSISSDCLVDLNDSGSTFEEISNIIEKHWKEM